MTEQEAISRFCEAFRNYRKARVEIQSVFGKICGGDFIERWSETDWLSDPESETEDAVKNVSLTFQDENLRKKQDALKTEIEEIERQIEQLYVD